VAHSARRVLIGAYPADMTLESLIQLGVLPLMDGELNNYFILPDPSVR
jgi:hypothetical protein